MRRPPLLVLLLFGGALVLWCSQAFPLSASGPKLAQPVPDMSAGPVTPREANADFWLPTVLKAGPTPTPTCVARPGETNAQRVLKKVRRASTASCPQGVLAIACAVAERASDVVVLAPGAGTRSEALRQRLLSARDAIVPRGRMVLLVALDKELEELARSVGIGYWRVKAMPGGGSNAEAAPWHAAAHLLRAGCTVVVSSPSIRWAADPFGSFSRDVDVEAAQMGGSAAAGSVIGVHDPPMVRAA